MSQPTVHFINYTVDKTSDAILLIEEIQKRLTGDALSTYMRQSVIPWLRGRADARFDSEGDEVSGKWAQLTYATSQIRDWMGYGPYHPINVRTGDLKDFIVHASGGLTQTANSAELTWPGDAVSPLLAEKIKTAQSGKSSPNTPARPVIGLGALDEKAITADLAWYIMQGAASLSIGVYSG